jgi:N-acetyl-anhydromuramyl-L-alanine amidase AmpD/outer membrane protein assembly factor BamB/predicted phosphodiesterase
VVLASGGRAAEIDDIRAEPDPVRVPASEFTAPGHHQPSAHLNIRPLPIEHFTPGDGEREIDTVVLHFTSGINVQPDDPYELVLNWKIFQHYSVSSHYMVERDGTINQLVRESDVAWHAGGSKLPAPDNREGANAFSIGIEIIGIHGEPFEDAQYESVIALVRDIRQRHPVPLTNVLGHEHTGGQRTVEMGIRRSAKIDPGPSFDWTRVMEGIAEITRPNEAKLAETAIEGTVYRDANGNGVRDAGEAGWPGVGVSNGDSIVLTDEQGHYRLEPSDEAMEIIYVLQPNSVELTHRFYTRVEEIADSSKVDFGMRPAPVHQGPLQFAQVSDVHVGRRTDFARFLKALEEVDNYPAPLDFLVATGDLVNRASVDEEIETYAAVSERSVRPWMHCFGNHDSDRGTSGTLWYRRFLGPDYYSFDRGDVHFVVRNSVIAEYDVMDRWIEEDIRLFGQGKTVVVFQHYPPTTADQYEHFANLGARAVVSGHWHSNRIVPYEELLSINTPTFMMGAIDVSPSGFRLITIADDTVTTRFIHGGTGSVLAVQNLADTLEVEAPVGQIWAAVHDSANDVESARFAIGEGPSGALEMISPLAWAAPIDPPISNLGPHSVQVVYTDARGDEHSVEQEFEVRAPPASDQKPAPTAWPMAFGGPEHQGNTDLTFKTPMRMDWIASSGVSIDFGSPVTDGERVYIGLRNRDLTGADLGNNGVAAHDLVTGERLWFAPTMTAITHTVATDGELVYASDQGGRVYAFDVETGATVWTYDLEDPTLRWVYAAPCLVDGHLICGSSKVLACVDPKTGEEHWSINPGGEFISSYASPAVADGVVVMGGVWQRFGGERLHSIGAHSLESGELLWVGTSHGLHGSPMIFESRVHTMDIQGVYRVHDLHSGELIAEHGLQGGWSTTTPAIDPDSGILVTAGADGVIYAFDTRADRELWRFHTDSSQFRMSPYQYGFNPVMGAPLIARGALGDLVFIGGGDGRLRALDLRTGRQEWSHDFGVPTVSGPCPTGDRLLVTALDGNLFCLRSSAAN